MEGGARIPDGLARFATETGGAALQWLEALPDLVAACADRWDLTLAPPFETEISYVAPVVRADGTNAVLKITLPDPESREEAAALRHWDGEGAVRLLDADGERSALLLERLEPGTSLWELRDEEEANAIAARVLERIWRPPPPGHPFETLADRAAPWIETIPRSWEALGRPFERELVEEAVAALRDLIPTQGEQVVVHQDFHGGNVLAAGREPWLAIDPKPLVGEREFDTASLLRDRRDELARDPHAPRRLRRRLDQLAGDLDLDRGRMRAWGIAHAVAWGFGPSGIYEEQIECARLLAATPP